MPIYTFKVTLIRSLARLYSFATKEEMQPALCLEISFRNVFSNDYDAWNKQPEGELVIDKIVNCRTQTLLILHELDIITQIEIRSFCFDYLRANELLRYPNIIPFQNLPYRCPAFSPDKSQTAELIEFPQR